MNNSKILQEAYSQFLLPLGGKKVPSPYRINIPFQPDRRRYGKSDSKTLTKDTIEIAKEQNFDLNKASIEEIRKFMEAQQLGIECSGFVYHLLDYLLQKTGKSMQAIGFPKASLTNVAKLTASEFATKISWDKAQPGDMIKLNSGGDLNHILIIIEVTNNIITYAHSSRVTKITGIHQDKIINGQFPEDLQVFGYNETAGDGVYRLKI